MAGIVAFAVFTSSSHDARQGRSVVEILDTLALSLGFGISQVEISGHNFTVDASIHETLDLAHVRSLLRFDSATVRQRIERLPWIDTATITRVFPDRLQIAVTERQPYARWQRGDRTFLIDPTGRILAPIQAGNITHLPLVSGEGAADAAQPLLSLLEHYADINGRLEAAERVDGRRWILRLEGGLAVHLPADGIATALDRLTAAGVTQGLEAMSATVVDARVAGRMSVLRKAIAQPLPAASRPAAGEAGSLPPDAGKEKQGAQRG